jgi:hypothetical protein
MRNAENENCIENENAFFMLNITPPPPKKKKP